MARKKRSKLTIKVKPKNTTPEDSKKFSGEEDLPPYVPYVDGTDKDGLPYRLFLEHPANEDLACIKANPTYRFIGAGKYSRGVASEKNIYTHTKDVMGEDFARIMACLVIKRVQSKRLSRGAMGATTKTLIDFATYLSKLPKEQQPQLLSDLTFLHFTDFLESHTDKSAKDYITPTFKLSKHYDKMGLSHVPSSDRSKRNTPPGDSPMFVNSIDELMEGDDFTDEEMMQILAYTLYQIDFATEQFEKIQNTTKEKIGINIIHLDDICTDNKALMKSMTDPEKGRDILIENLYYHYRADFNGEERYWPKQTLYLTYITKLLHLSETNKFKKEHPKAKFSINWLFENLLSAHYPLDKETFKKQQKEKTLPRNFHEFLRGQSLHVEWAIVTFIMISAGVNLEVVNSFKWSINGKPWYENYDLDLGLDEDTPKKEAQIVLVGRKHKGQGFGYKTIAIPIKVNSPIYDYCKYLDKIRPSNREYIFNLHSYSKIAKSFVLKHKIVDRKGEQLINLESKKFRKVYAGHKLISMLDGVNSPDELVSKLKKAVDHNNFDTTFFSYLLQSGAANLVLNSAIVSLQTSFIEKAVEFKGTIHPDDKDRKRENEVFLCDCSDPTQPTHGIPVAKICRKYDMCLGCSRSEVYVDHLPRIFYRIFQYEDMRTSNYEQFRATCEDRLIIATEVIDRFKFEHHKGQEVVDNAYKTASDAYRDGIALLPDILQIS